MERKIGHQEYYPIEETIRKGGGGKLEVTKKLQEAGFPVPRSQYLYFDDLNNSRLIEAAYKELNSPVIIVRASHINDWQGYIDVLPTFRDIKNIGNKINLAHDWLHNKTGLGNDFLGWVDLPFKIVDYFNMDTKIKEMSLEDRQYGIILDEKLNFNLDPGIKTGTLLTFISTEEQNSTSYLEHNLYRFMKKAHYSIINGYIPNKDLFKNIDPNETIFFKLISNGERAVLLYPSN